MSASGDGLVSSEVWIGEADLMKKSLVGDSIKWLGESVCSHIVCMNVLNAYVAIADALLDVVVVDVYMLCPFMVTLGGEQLGSRLVVAFQQDWVSVWGVVADLAEQAL